MQTNLPNARRDALVLQEVDDELVVQDTANNQVHLLNDTAAVIWKLCDGKTGVTEIAARATRALNAPVDTNLVWYTLEQLSKKNLLQAPVTRPSQMLGMTRRDFLRAGLVGTAVVLPVIISIAAPSVASAASCIASGQACTPGVDICCNGSVTCPVGGSCP